jgi:hypothetical protein
MYHTNKHRSKDEVQRQVVEYFRQYHPWGYGTSVLPEYRADGYKESNPLVAPEIEGDEYTVTIRRASSCD